MPIAAVKALYVASSLAELKDKSTVRLTCSAKTTSQLVKTAKKLYESVMECECQDEKDEERIYCYLFRVMEVYMMIMSSEDAKKDKTYYTLMIGKQMTKVMKMLEDYGPRLNRRYDVLKQSKEDEKRSSDTSQFKIVSSITVKKPKEGTGKTLSRDVSPGYVTADNYYELTTSLTDLSKLNDDEYESTIPGKYAEKKFIHCSELKELVISTSVMDLLVLDIRPEKDFESSRIADVHFVNIPETSITPGLSANKLGMLITNVQQRYCWEKREQYTQIVLMDWNSQEKDVVPSTPLFNLQNSLIKWDPNSVYKNKPLILIEGFENFLDRHPTLTTNPKIKAPQKKHTNSFIHLDDHHIEYPMSELEESPFPKLLEPLIPQTTDLPPKPAMSKPNIDRSTKPDKSHTIVQKPQDESEDGDNNMETESRKTAQEVSWAKDEDLLATPTDISAVVPTSSNTVPRERVREQSPESPRTLSRPLTPPRQEKPPSSITSKNKPAAGVTGDGDSNIVLEKLKDIPRGPSLKRASSSPQLNKLVDEESHSSPHPTPEFDRRTKPKPSSAIESYVPRDGITDTIYHSANNKGRGLTGLKNLGNLCYMNSIMQCISNTVELMHALTEFNIKEASTRQHIAPEVRSLLRTLWQGDTRITSCRPLKSKVGSLKHSFSTNEQQDSHEFLTILMDWLHEDLNEPPEINLLDGADEATGEKSWGEFRKKNNSKILKLFYGQLKSTVTCNHCEKQSIQFEPFSNLSVPLPQDTSYDRDCSIQECLRLYLKGETISGWKCSNCHTEREATKKLDITMLPPILIIHLKRFMNENISMGWCRKRINLVDYPISGFDMKPFTHPNSELRHHTYNLYAVSNHFGTMDSGHYTSHCKNHLLNKWYNFDDQEVKEMSPADVKSSAAYILFYESDHLRRQGTMID